MRAPTNRILVHFDSWHPLMVGLYHDPHFTAPNEAVATGD
jgi:hypothetical protein